MNYIIEFLAEVDWEKAKDFVWFLCACVLLITTIIGCVMGIIVAHDFFTWIHALLT